MNPLFKITFLAVMLTVSFANAAPAIKEINQIRDEYTAIEGAALKSAVIKLDLDEESVQLTKYFLNGALVKLVFVSRNGHGTVTDLYYLKNDVLFYVYETSVGGYFDLSNGNGGGVETGREQQVYYKNGKVIRHFIKEVETRETNQIPQLLAKAMRKTARNKKASVQFASDGKRLAQVNTKADLKRYLYAE